MDVICIYFADADIGFCNTTDMDADIKISHPHKCGCGSGCKCVQYFDDALFNIITSVIVRWQLLYHSAFLILKFYDKNK